MAPRSKKSDPVEAARNDLAAAEATLAEIAARETEAVASAETFASWRRERDEAIAEVARCRKLVEQLEVAAAEEAEQERLARIQKRRNDQQAASEALASRFREEGAPAMEIVLDFARAFAADDVAVAGLNAVLGEDEQIVGADLLARNRAPAPREVLSEKRIQLWVFASTGSIVGDQGKVQDLGDGNGQIAISNGFTRCLRCDFWQVEYREAEPRQRFEPFFSALRLPDAAGPGFVWNPSDRLTPASALEVLERRATGSERQVLTEIVKFRPVDAA